MGFCRGVDHNYELDGEPFKKKILTMFEKRIGQILSGKSSSSVLVPYRNRSGVVDLVGREPLMFAKAENGVTKSCQIFRRKNAQENNAFWPDFFHFIEQDRLLFERVDIGVTEFPTKTAKTELKNSV